MASKESDIFPRLIWQGSDYIIGFVTLAIGPNKFKKLTWLLALAHNIIYIWQSLNEKQHNYMACLWSHVCCLLSNFAMCIVCWHYKPCELLAFVWTDCLGNKSNYSVVSNKCSPSYACLPIIFMTKMFKIFFLDFRVFSYVSKLTTVLWIGIQLLGS